jgi:hypothetical protein
MRQINAFFVLAACLVMLPAIGNAKGCLKGAAVGGVAGHIATQSQNGTPSNDGARSPGK